jgi:hypothetical protein
VKLSLVVGAAVGYLLGAKAGRERYDAIVATARRVAGSQTVQATAGILQAQLDTATQRARAGIAARLHAAAPTSRPGAPAGLGVNGSRH